MCYESGGAAISESPPSEGGAMMVRILVGWRTGGPSGLACSGSQGGILVVGGGLGFVDPEREGAAEAVNDVPADFPLPDPLPTGADIETADSRGRLTPDNLSPFLAPVAYSESFSPTQDRANHRPPAIPRISRLATRQCLTFLRLLSRGKGGANPVAILGGG